MVFCNLRGSDGLKNGQKRHNPYFNRWFSAILLNKQSLTMTNVTILILIDGFLQYSNMSFEEYGKLCHNPYFNRWFSAM